MLHFDLRTPDSAYDFILRMCKMTGQEFIEDFHVNCSADFEIFWEKHYSQLKSINSDRIKIYAFHITGSLDRCNSIKKYGILNLQAMLSSHSILNEMLNKYGVQIDIEHKLLIYKKKIYDIDYSNYRGKFNLYGLDKQLSSIAYRVSYDYTVNGFLCTDDVFSYGTNIHLRPEFLLDLTNAFPDLKALEEEWVSKTCSYRIDYYTYTNQLQRFNFSLDEYRDPPCENWDCLNDNEKILKWMLSHAISRAFEELGETYLYLRDELGVPPNQIISYTELN